MTAVVRRTGVDICIGGVTVRVRSSGKAFLRMLDERYAGFMVHGGVPDYEFDVELTPPRDGSPDDDVRVWRSDGLWHYFTPKELGAIVHTLPPREAAEMLVGKARHRARGGGDNLSLALVRVEPAR